MWSLFFPCESRWLGDAPADAPRTLEEAITYIDKVYDSGRPFFTQEAMREALKQIQKSNDNGDKIRLDTIGGIAVEFTFGEPNLEAIALGSPGIQLPENLTGVTTLSYRTRNHLISWLRNETQNTPNDTRDDISKNDLRHGDLHGKFDNESHGKQFDLEGRHISGYLCSVHVVKSTRIISDPPLVQNLSYGDSTAQLKRKNREWQKSKMCKKLQQILNTSAASHDIRKIVAVALGTFSIKVPKEFIYFSPVQHALLLTVREWLLTRRKTIDCFAQDPDYLDADKRILEKHGVEVVDDPRAWLEVDDNSILYSVAPSCPTKAIIADIARPAVVIWERVTEEDYRMEKSTDPDDQPTDPCEPRVRAMLEEYEMFEFGADDDFLGAVVYVRRRRD